MALGRDKQHLLSNASLSRRAMPTPAPREGVGAVVPPHTSFVDGLRFSVCDYLVPKNAKRKTNTTAPAGAKAR